MPAAKAVGYTAMLESNPSTVTTKYCYDGYQVIVEYDENDNVKQFYVYGPGFVAADTN